MLTCYETLYNYAKRQEDLTRWLHDIDIVKDYLQCLGHSAHQQEQLKSTLTGEELDLFLKFGENLDAVQDYEQQMLFCQGLSIGLELGLRALL